MFGIGPLEMLIVGGLAVLLFGSRVPDVARQLGQGLKQFKDGMSGIEGEFRSAMNGTPSPANRTASRPNRFDAIDDRETVSGPKFEPPPSEPS